MWLKDTDTIGRALIEYRSNGLVFETSEVEGTIRILGVEPSDLGLENVGEKADVELRPKNFRRGRSTNTHYLQASIERVIDTKPAAHGKKSSSKEKYSVQNSSTSGSEEGSKSRKKNTGKTTDLADVNRNSRFVVVEAWVNVVSNFGPDYIQQKVWLGDKTEQEFPLVINNKYEGKLVRSEHKYRFENVSGNYNKKQSEVQLVANHSSTIKHKRSKSNTSKPKWRDS